MGPPLAGGTIEVRSNVDRVAVQGGPWQLDPRLLKLAIGTWNVTSLMGKKPELVQEIERYWLDIIGLTSMHSLGSGVSLLERG